MWRFNCFSILGLLWVLVCPSLWPQQVTLDVVEDGWIHGLNSSTVGGTGNDLAICPTADYWIYLKFDLTEIEGKIGAAEVQLVRKTGSKPEQISLYFISDNSWSEASLTGPNRDRLHPKTCSRWVSSLKSRTGGAGVRLISRQRFAPKPRETAP